jgi:hypothetical protein
VQWASRLMWAPVARAGLFFVRLRSSVESQPFLIWEMSVEPSRPPASRTAANSSSTQSSRLSVTPSNLTSPLASTTSSRTAQSRPSPETRPVTT